METPKQITLREWVKNYQEGKYNSKDYHVMCEAGWFDWFCKDNSLLGRLKELAPKIIWFYDQNIVDPDKTYVIFKNNCPLVGRLYDDFRICDIKTRDVICTIIPKDGRDNSAQIWGKDNTDPLGEEFGEIKTTNNWTNLKSWIASNKNYLKHRFGFKEV